MVESIKDLERLLKLCRKQGVLEITLASVSLKLGDMPVRHPQEVEEETEQFNPFDEPLTPSELVSFANGGN